MVMKCRVVVLTILPKKWKQIPIAKGKSVIILLAESKTQITKTCNLVPIVSPPTGGVSWIRPKVLAVLSAFVASVLAMV